MTRASTPSVSVVIAAYQAERTIVGALQSVLGQTVLPDEIIVVDDGSSDETSARTLRTIRNVRRVQLVRLARNRGVAVALNHGIERCIADVLMFLDADDLWETNAVAVQTRHLIERRHDAAVFGRSAVFRDPAAVLDLAAARTAAETRPVGPQKGAMAIWRQEFLRIGWFDPAATRSDFLGWLTRASTMALITSTHPEIVLYRRVHGSNMGIEHRAEQADQYLELMRSITQRRRASRTSGGPSRADRSDGSDGSDGSP